ncbi:MAG TPA: hypothetical protein VNR42_01210 [Solirubrobacteraceae bacterium]|nr:hypothetical protein [Solirubrobacteraceae bacterium]
MMALTLRSTVPQPNHAMRLMVVLLTGVLVAGVAVAVLCGGHADALQAAGAFKGEEIGGVAHFVEKLKGNLVWFGGTAMGLVVAVVGIMFMAGHSRAHDVAIKTIAGLLILASISGIVA